MKKRSVICAVFYVSAAVLITGCGLAKIHDTDKPVYEAVLYRDRGQSFTLPHIQSDFGLVSAFYRDICLNFGLLRSIDADTLRKSCAVITASLKAGKKIQFAVKNYEDGAELTFNFGQLPDAEGSVFITSNYDMHENRLLRSDESVENSWGALFFVIDGCVIDYRAPDNAPKTENAADYARGLLYDKNPSNDHEAVGFLEKYIAGEFSPHALIVLAQLYFNGKNIEKGVKLLEDNKDAILKSAVHDDDLRDAFDCAYEEGKALELIYGQL